MYHLQLPENVQRPGGSGQLASAELGPFEGFNIATVPQVGAGDVRLFRQAAFKGEALVPVVPTAFAVILLPDSPLTDGTETCSVLGAAVAEFLTACLPDRARRERVAQYCDFTIVQAAASTGSGLRSLVVVDASRLATECPGALDDVYSDGCNVILDVIDGVAFAPRPFNAAYSRQYAVALPCDPRVDTFVSAGPSAWSALPTCLSCLDRLDRYVSGVTSGHGPCRCGSHCRCHPRTAATCPTCRAVRGLPEVAARGGQLRCNECGVAEDLWACLVCGYVGCSRYRDEHAKRHWEQSGHEFVLSIVSQQIWDYAADALAHRLIVAFDADDAGAAQAFELPERDSDQRFVTAKLMGLPGGDAAATVVPDGAHGKGKKGGKGDGLPTKYLVDAKVESKVEEMCLDFSRQLQSQLEAQRRQLAAAYGDVAGHLAAYAASDASTPTSSAVKPSAFASFDGAVARAVAKWNVATAGASSLMAKSAAAEAEAAALEAEEVELTAKQERLKEQLKAGLLERHRAAEERRQRVRELTEMITEAQLNLDARKRVAARGLSAADQASSFAVARSAPSRRRR